MLLCPRCGIENDPGSTACWACSLELGQPEQSAARSREPGGFKTIPGAGGATPRSAEPGGFKTIPGAGGAAPRSAEPGGFRTIPGTGSSPPQAPVKPGMKQTMLGGIAPFAMPPGAAAQPPPVQGSVEPAAPRNPLQVGTAPRTVLGGFAQPAAVEPNTALAPTEPDAPALTGPTTLRQTVLGVAPPSPGQAQPSGALQQTVLGVPAISGQPADSLQNTVRGVAAPAVVGAQPVGGFHQATPAPAAAPKTQGQPVGTLKQTVLGVAAPSALLGEPLDVVKQTVVGYGQLSESEPLSQHFLPVPGEQSAAPARPGIKQTVLGVAVPGVAPVHPGAETSYPSRAGAAVQQLGGTALSDAELAFLPGRRRRGRQALWIAATAAILAIVLSGLVVLFLRRGAARVEARVSVDALGNERLDVSCEDCATGTQVALGSRSAKFNAKRAILELNVPLIVGENKLTLGLRSPGSSQEEKVEILVPVQYRVRGDLEGLNETPPKLRVLARAVPGTTVAMDGKAIAQAANGSAVYELDVGTALTGQSAQVASLERRIPYTITPSGAPPHRDEVRFQLSIVPLIVRAPGESVVIDSASFMLVGQTLKGASVSVAGRPIEVDAQGSFTQLMSVSAVGETVILVRASAPERAPRLVPIRVKRVESLTEEAKKFRENATVSYQTIASDIAGKRGVPVAWVAGVVEARVEDTSILLVDVRSGCDSPPCLARVVLGKKSDFSSGQLVTVFGTVSGGVAGPRSGTEIPELHADFILPGQN